MSRKILLLISFGIIFIVSCSSAPVDWKNENLLVHHPKLREVIESEEDRSERRQEIAPDAMLNGAWIDKSTGTTHFIRKTAAGFEVESILDRNKAPLEVLYSSYSDGVLRWGYRVEKTGFYIVFSTMNLDGDSLECSWTNEQEEGSEILSRRENAEFDVFFSEQR